MDSCSLDEIYSFTSTAETSIKFLQQRGILKSSMTCSSCSADMALVPCSSTKSKDSFIWYCYPCRRSNVRTGSVLSGRKLTFKSFLLLIFFLSCKGVANVLLPNLLLVLRQHSPLHPLDLHRGRDTEHIPAEWTTSWRPTTLYWRHRHQLV